MGHAIYAFHIASVGNGNAKVVKPAFILVNQFNFRQFNFRQFYYVCAALCHRAFFIFSKRDDS